MSSLSRPALVRILYLFDGTASAPKSRRQCGPAPTHGVTIDAGCCPAASGTCTPCTCPTTAPYFMCVIGIADDIDDIEFCKAVSAIRRQRQTGQTTSTTAWHLGSRAQAPPTASQRPTAALVRPPTTTVRPSSTPLALPHDDDDAVHHRSPSGSTPHSAHLCACSLAHFRLTAHLSPDVTDDKDDD